MATLEEEFDREGMPRVLRGMGESLVGPSIIVQGTDEQRDSFLPYERELWDLADTARGVGRHADPLVRQDLARPTPRCS